MSMHASQASFDAVNAKRWLHVLPNLTESVGVPLTRVELIDMDIILKQRIDDIDAAEPANSLYRQIKDIGTWIIYSAENEGEQ